MYELYKLVFIDQHMTSGDVFFNTEVMDELHLRYHLKECYDGGKFTEPTREHIRELVDTNSDDWFGEIELSDILDIYMTEDWYIEQFEVELN